MKSSALEQRVFLVLLVVVSLAFAWIISPLYGAVFWGTVLAILFAPFYRRILLRTGLHRNVAAFTTLLLCLIIVILPLMVLMASLINEATAVYQRVSTRQLDIGLLLRTFLDGLPPGLVRVLDHFGLNDIVILEQKLTQSLMQGSQIVARQAVTVGQNAFQFVISFAAMLYLLFFLLRDGSVLSARIRDAIPLSLVHKQQLFSRFAAVIRATVKGNIAVAVVQGFLGGVIFWLLGIQAALLWGVTMSILSLLPAVGAGLVWVPVALYFLLAGPVWKGVTLLAFGVFVIGLVDNILRPVLVGKDTQMPDYVILISTLGGMVLFGLTGFVIGPTVAALFIAFWDLFSPSSDESNQGRSFSARQ